MNVHEAVVEVLERADAELTMGELGQAVALLLGREVNHRWVTFAVAHLRKAGAIAMVGSYHFRRYRLADPDPDPDVEKSHRDPDPDPVLPDPEVHRDGRIFSSRKGDEDDDDDGRRDPDPDPDVDPDVDPDPDDEERLTRAIGAAVAAFTRELHRPRREKRRPSSPSRGRPRRERVSDPTAPSATVDPVQLDEAVGQCLREYVDACRARGKPIESEGGLEHVIRSSLLAQPQKLAGALARAERRKRDEEAAKRIAAAAAAAASDSVEVRAAEERAAEERARRTARLADLSARYPVELERARLQARELVSSGPKTWSGKGEFEERIAERVLELLEDRARDDAATKVGAA